MGLQTSILGLYILSNLAAENNQKTIKNKIRENQKQKLGSCWFGSTDNEYDCI